MSDTEKSVNSIGDRVKMLGLPLDQLIVIGSGILDVLGIRRASDVDILVTREVFKNLSSDATWKSDKAESGSLRLSKNDYEVFYDWSDTGSEYPDFDDLVSYTTEIEGVRYVSLDYLRERKLSRGWEKDLGDVRLIDEYLENAHE